jgi:hypothetical protein
MSLIPTWPFVVGGLLIGAAGGAALDHTIMAGRIDRMEKATADVERQRAEIYAADQMAARATQQAWADQIGRIEQEKQNEIDRVRAAGAAALAGLRNRPDRQPAGQGGVPQATAACAGATGAELYRSDATFLVGEAARADEQRAALAACYGAYDALK